VLSLALFFVADLACGESITKLSLPLGNVGMASLQCPGRKVQKVDVEEAQICTLANGKLGVASVLLLQVHSSEQTSGAVYIAAFTSSGAKRIAGLALTYTDGSVTLDFAAVMEGGNALDVATTTSSQMTQHTWYCLAGAKWVAIHGVQESCAATFSEKKQGGAFTLDEVCATGKTRTLVFNGKRYIAR
jgi:hypothetical protein